MPLNYEAKGLIQPDKKDATTGNRYYTIDTFTQIRIPDEKEMSELIEEMKANPLKSA